MANGYIEYASKEYVDQQLVNKADAEHSHTISDITNLYSTLDGKANADHIHMLLTSNNGNTAVIQDDGNFVIYDPNGEALFSTQGMLGHTHDASNITSGTLTSDRLPTIPVAKGGTGCTSIADTIYTDARYRASSLNAAETTPTINGVIAWTYE